MLMLELPESRTSPAPKMQLTFLRIILDEPDMSRLPPSTSVKRGIVESEA